MSSSSSCTDSSQSSSVPATRRGPYARISTDLKERLVLAWEEGRDFIEVARLLGINVTTARSIVAKYLRDGNINDQRGGRREEWVRLTPAVVNEIVDLVEQHPDFTLEQIRGQLQVSLSIATISRALDSQLITMKKLEDCPAKRNSLSTRENRSQYAEWYLETGINRTLVYVDETCFNIYTKRTRGRAVKGRPAVRQVSGYRGPNLNLVMAISARAGVVYYELQRGCMTSEFYFRFIFF